MLPDHSRYVIVGAGIHGLSTAWHLAAELRRRGLGSGADVVVLDKRGVGAGASGIACGVIRNNYFQPAMRELMAHSVAVWESDQEAFAYHPVGYLQIAPEAMHADVAKISAEQQADGVAAVGQVGPVLTCRGSVPGRVAGDTAGDGTDFGLLKRWFTARGVVS